MKEQLRAWIYCRIDAPEDEHGSLKSQKEELYNYAEQMDFIVTGSSQDTGSGLKMNHSGLLEALQAAENGKIDVLLVKRLDRISRDTLKTIELLQNLKQLGITVYSPLEGEIRLEQQRLSLFLR
ncbi:MAG TPA: recombinase family protein [Desulfomonilia bacterium]